jgi:hypothetical protein
MELTLQNLLYFAGRLGPYILVFFFVMVSIFNQDFKGLLYISGILFASTFAIILSASTRSLFQDISNANAYCSMSDVTVSRFPLSSVIIGFSLFYIFIPMINLLGGVTNPLLIFVMLLFVFMDVAFLVSNNCSSMKNFGPFGPILISYGIGGFCAYLFVLLCTSTDHNELLYFGNDSSGPLCKLNRNKKMRCSVYKNGELITTQ